MICPHCKETILSGAVYCKHCRRRVERSVWPIVLGVAGGLLVLFLFLVFRPHGTPAPERVGMTVSRPVELIPAAQAPPAPLPDRAAAGEKPSETKASLETLKAAVLRIEGPEVVGSGFLISEDGKVVTCAHVVGDARNIAIRFQDGSTGTAIVLQTYAEADLALLQMLSSVSYPHIWLGDSTSLTAGQEVTVLGFPMGLDTQVLTRGVVSAAPIYLPIADIPLIQIDASVNPGNSGGPVLDPSGRAVGVVAVKLRDAEGMNYAVPVNYAAQFGVPQAEGLDSLAFKNWRQEARARQQAAPVPVARPAGSSKEEGILSVRP